MRYLAVVIVVIGGVVSAALADDKFPIHVYACLRAAGRKTIVFFERIRSAEGAAEDISLLCGRRLQKSLSGSTWCKVFHSQLKKDQRTETLNEFRAASSSVLIACRGLDEGLNIRDVDAAILAASTQSLRQRIQRIGRCLRVQDGKSAPIIITLYIKGTVDENVLANDPEVFDGVATIHDVTCEDAGQTLGKLLGMPIAGRICTRGAPKAVECHNMNDDGELESQNLLKKEGVRLTVKQLAGHLDLAYPATVRELERHGLFRPDPSTVVYGKIVERLCRHYGKPIPQSNSY